MSDTVDRVARLVACAVATGDPADPAPLISYLALPETPQEHLALVRPLRQTTRETLNDRIRRELAAVKGAPVLEVDGVE